MAAHPSWVLAHFLCVCENNDMRWRCVKAAQNVIVACQKRLFWALFWGAAPFLWQLLICWPLLVHCPSFLAFIVPLAPVVCFMSQRFQSSGAVYQPV